MTKFCLSESKNVIASVTDPVALDCINRLAQDVSDDTTVIAGQQLKQEDSFTDSERVPTAHEQTELTELDGLPSCTTNQDLLAASLAVTMAAASPSDRDSGIAVMSQSSSTVSQQTAAVSSQIPLFIASHDLLSLPVITLPVVACSIASSGGIMLNETGGSEKSYVTVAAMAMDDISTLPENAVFKPTYSAL